MNDKECRYTISVKTVNNIIFGGEISEDEFISAINGKVPLITVPKRNGGRVKVDLSEVAYDSYDLFINNKLITSKENRKENVPWFELAVENRLDSPVIKIDGEVVDIKNIEYMVFDQGMMIVTNPYATKWIDEKIKHSVELVTNENQRNGIFGKIYYMAKNILPWNLDCYREKRQAVDDEIKESKEKYLEEKSKK